MALTGLDRRQRGKKLSTAKIAPHEPLTGLGSCHVRPIIVISLLRCQTRRCVIRRRDGRARERQGSHSDARDWPIVISLKQGLVSEASKYRWLSGTVGQSQHHIAKETLHLGSAVKREWNRSKQWMREDATTLRDRSDMVGSWSGSWFSTGQIQRSQKGLTKRGGIGRKDSHGGHSGNKSETCP